MTAQPPRRARRSACALPAALALLSSGPAAAVPLVYAEGAPAELRAEVERATGLPPGQLEPVALSALLGRPPAMVGSGALRHCAGAPVRGPELRAAALRAEAAIGNGDAGQAQDQLDLALGAMGCLSERVEPPVAARIFMLRAEAQVRRADPEAARNELRTALAFQPEIAPLTSFSPEAAALLEAERAAYFQCPSPSGCAGLLPVVVRPGARSAGPWVDGVAAPAAEPLRLTPGLHLLQVASTAGLRSAWLTVEGPSALVIPSAWRGAPLPGLADAAAAPELIDLLRAGLPQASLAYATAGGAIWLVDLAPDGGSVTTVVAPPPPAAPDKVEKPDKKRR
jgi:hypothetical protein